MPRLALVLICSAFLGLLPLTDGYGQWVEPPGTGWVQLQFSHHDTRTRFNENANTVPYFNEDARSITRTGRLTGALGLWSGIDVWGEIPVHHLQFDDATRERTSAGIGDPRLFLRTGSSLLGIESLPLAVALRGGVKFPVGEFNVDAEVIPLSEGQRDWELLLELGKSLHPWPLYVVGWVGYRWREVNKTSTIKPGDERILYLGAGGHVDRFQWKVAVDGLFGRTPEFSGIPLETNRRALVQLIPRVGWSVGPGAVEAGARVPLHGRNLPAGPTVTLGYFLSWDEPLWTW